MPTATDTHTKKTKTRTLTSLDVHMEPLSYTIRLANDLKWLQASSHQLIALVVFKQEQVDTFLLGQCLDDLKATGPELY
ncbi:MAG: hypothetical protein NVS4B8_28570 [Herpetosiphon sp.]